MEPSEGIPSAAGNDSNQGPTFRQTDPGIIGMLGVILFVLSLTAFLNYFLLSEINSPQGIFLIEFSLFGLDIVFTMLWLILAGIVLLIDLVVIVGGLATLYRKFVPSNQEAQGPFVPLTTGQQRLRGLMFIVFMVLGSLFLLIIMHALYPIYQPHEQTLDSFIPGLGTVFVTSVLLWLSSYAIATKEVFSEQDITIITLGLVSPLLLISFGIFSGQYTTITFNDWYDAVFRVYFGIVIFGLASTDRTRLIMIVIGSGLVLMADYFFLGSIALQGSMNQYLTYTVLVTTVWAAQLLVRKSREMKEYEERTKDPRDATSEMISPSNQL